MTGLVLRRAPLLGIAALVWLLLTTPAGACPFCTMQGQTLTQEVNQASMVAFGTLANAKLAAGGDEFGGGTTDLLVEAVIKPHADFADKKVLTLPRYVPPDQNSKYKYLVFFDVFKGKLDPYRGVVISGKSDLPKYLKGALDVKDKKVEERLRFFFDYLDNEDVEISNDAYKEFGNSDYKDFKAMAKDLPAEKVVKWLQDPKTPGFRYGLYASMLGHCGKAEHAAVLKGMLEDPEKRVGSGIDGILAGYAMLQPKEGWSYLRGVLKDEKKDFMFRYAALRAVRFFWDSRPDEVLPKKELLDGACELLPQSDIADLAIEDLRKWKQWDVADKVLALAGKESHDIPIIRRSILRYALRCPKPEAAKFVDSVKAKDPQLVKDAEELLSLEDPAPAKGQASK